MRIQYTYTIKMKINCYVIFGLWAIAYATNALCVLIEGPLEYTFQLQEYTKRRLSDDSMLEMPDEVMYLYKYSDEDNYGIGTRSTGGYYLMNEYQAFAAHEIDYHIMNRTRIQISLQQHNLFLKMDFLNIEDAQAFYMRSFNYRNRRPIGPFELKLSLMRSKTTLLNLYELENGIMLCEFEAPNDSTSRNSLPQLVLPTTSFSHTQIYHLRVMALIEDLAIFHVIKFKTYLDATAFKMQITGKSVCDNEISDAFKLLIDNFNETCTF